LKDYFLIYIREKKGIRWKANKGARLMAQGIRRMAEDRSVYLLA